MRLATPIKSLIDEVLTTAILQNASDIHFEPYQQFYRVRLRVDGLLYEKNRPELALNQAIASRLKIMAECDIAEKRLPQDGRFLFQTNQGLKRYCRLSTIPTLHGEKIVVRLLRPDDEILSLEQLGLNTNQLITLKKCLAIPQGLILVTGPTGSGKSATLYSCLHALNNQQKNITTIEQPIEIQIPGVNQVNINSKIGLDFPKALRAFLRQDPDVIMIGEIRDHETATIAIRAAQTGHLVLASVHCNSAKQCLTRLKNLGVAAYNLQQTQTLIIGQRLLRKICQTCRGICSENCDSCYQGYHQRTGVFELYSESLHCSKKSLIENAQHLVNHKITDQNEVTRVLGSH